MLKGILDLIRGGQMPDRSEGGLTAADAKAIRVDLAPIDGIEDGLGAALAKFVLTGEGETALLRVDNVLRTPDERSGHLHALLHATWYSPPGMDFSNEKERDRRQRDADERMERRRRVLFGLEGFDPAALRRFGQVLTQGSQILWGTGTDRSPNWLRQIFAQVRQNHRGRQKGLDHGILTAARVQDMLAIEDASVGALVDIVFGRHSDIQYYRHLPGLPEMMKAEVEAVLSEAAQLPASARGPFLLYIGEAGLVGRVPAYFEYTFVQAASKTRSVQEAAITALLRGDRAKVEARAAEALGAARVEERLAAISVLAALLGAEALPRLEAHQAAETAKPVLQLIETLKPKLALAGAAAATAEADGPEGYVAVDGRFVAAPPRQPPDDRLPEDTAEVLRDLMAESAKNSRREYDNPGPLPDYLRKQRRGYRPPHDPSEIPALIELMNGARRGGKGSPHLNPMLPQYLPQTAQAYARGIAALLARPDFGVKPLARLFAAENTQPWQYALYSIITRGTNHYGLVQTALARRIAAGADFRDVAEALEEAGFPAAEGVPLLIGSRYYQEPAEAADPTVWPVLAAQFAAVDAMIAARPRSEAHWPVINLCGLFPSPPRRYLDTLLDAGAQGASAARRQARALLAGAGDLTPVIAPLLKDGSAPKRAGAARWLADRKAASAIAPLRAALGKEKNLVARAAILAALAACGDDIADQFSEERLLEEARREGPKIKADFSAMLDPAALPRLRWADGRAVDPEIVGYWFARAHALKQPGGDPLLHMALDRLDRGDAEAMGRTLLSAFIQLDTRKASSDEANAYAEANADARHQAYSRWNKEYTREKAFADLRQEKLGQYLGSALDHRGLLALARFAPPVEAVAQVRRYLRDHGKRANQSRALLDLLAANPVPGNLQLILDVAQRLKQPGSRKYAGELGQRIAEERGWSAAELADRTVPDLDLDERGARPLPIGDRTFQLTLEDGPGGALRLAILNPSGKAVSSLPSPTDPAGAEQARAAKKTVSAARKELQQTVELQTRRLYEAMCVGRRWDAADFAAALVPHPVLQRLLRRLVLTGHDADGKVVASARLLEDGSLTDREDAAVRLDGLTTIGIAHRVTLGEEAAAAWRAHLDDYEVVPLFAQLDRPLLTLTDQDATEIEDRQGYLIDTATLRTAATKLGYAPGGAEDGGVFSTYEKTFPELGLAAAIGFTGAAMGDKERRSGALHDLRFLRLRAGKAPGWGAQGIELSKVPPILLQEAWNDLHAIAAAGTGFDPAWQTKSYW